MLSILSFLEGKLISFIASWTVFVRQINIQLIDSLIVYSRHNMNFCSTFNTFSGMFSRARKGMWVTESLLMLKKNKSS